LKKFISLGFISILLTFAPISNSQAQSPTSCIDSEWHLDKNHSIDVSKTSNTYSIHVFEIKCVGSSGHAKLNKLDSVTVPIVGYQGFSVKVQASCDRPQSIGLQNYNVVILEERGMPYKAWILQNDKLHSYSLTKTKCK
jgi:hypothetical protein